MKRLSYSASLCGLVVSRRCGYTTFIQSPPTLPALASGKGCPICAAARHRNWGAQHARPDYTTPRPLAKPPHRALGCGHDSMAPFSEELYEPFCPPLPPARNMAPDSNKPLIPHLSTTASSYSHTGSVPPSPQRRESAERRSFKADGRWRSMSAHWPCLAHPTRASNAIARRDEATAYPCRTACPYRDPVEYPAMADVARDFRDAEPSMSLDRLASRIRDLAPPARSPQDRPDEMAVRVDDDHQSGRDRGTAFTPRSINRPRWRSFASTRTRPKIGCDATARAPCRWNPHRPVPMIHQRHQRSRRRTLSNALTGKLDRRSAQHS